MDNRALSQGDQILDQLRRFDAKKRHRSKSGSESFLGRGSRNVSTNRLNELGETGVLGNSLDTPVDADDTLESSEQLAEGLVKVHFFADDLVPHQYTALKIEDVKPRYVPPINFAVVESGLYRSGHPQPFNFDFLETLKLKTIIYLGDKTDNYDYYRWIKEKGINFRFFSLKEMGKANANDSTMDHGSELMNSALNLLLNRDNYPILIHSNKGKHRVGVLVGLVRAYLQGWTLSGAFDEYGKFSREKGDYDLEFIEMFEPQLVVDFFKQPEFVQLSEFTSGGAAA